MGLAAGLARNYKYFFLLEYRTTIPVRAGTPFQLPTMRIRLLGWSGGAEPGAFPHPGGAVCSPQTPASLAQRG